MFDPDWKAHGHLDRAVAMIEQWSRAARDRRAARGGREARGPYTADLHGGAGRGDDTVLLYGHCDKQPEMVGWVRARPLDAGAAR